jgi:hypothetical protein
VLGSTLVIAALDGRRTDGQDASGINPVQPDV